MRRMPSLLLALPFVLAGCSGLMESGPDPDGVTCAHSQGARAVRIDIESYQHGPKGDCTVDRGTRITWRAPPGEPRPFTLEFTRGSPDGTRTRPVHPSRDRGDRQALVLDATGAPGAYPYLVKVDGVEIDPAIIIR